MPICKAGAHPASDLLGKRLKRLVWPVVPDLLLNLKRPPPCSRAKRYSLIRATGQHNMLVNGTVASTAVGGAYQEEQRAEWTTHTEAGRRQRCPF